MPRGGDSYSSTTPLFELRIFLLFSFPDSSLLSTADRRKQGRGGASIIVTWCGSLAEGSDPSRLYFLQAPGSFPTFIMYTPDRTTSLRPPPRSSTASTSSLMAIDTVAPAEDVPEERTGLLDPEGGNEFYGSMTPTSGELLTPRIQ